MQRRRMYAQPSGEMLESPANYNADGRSLLLFFLFCFSIFGIFFFRSLASGGSFHVHLSQQELILIYELSFFGLTFQYLKLK